MNAAALMTADQYRTQAQLFLDRAEEQPTGTYAMRTHLVACAQVYALLAISAQSAENREDVPF